jgi:hypothetical protein
MKNTVIAVCAALFVSAPSKTRADIVGAVVRQLTAIPDLQTLQAYSVVYATLLKAFPCR